MLGVRVAVLLLCLLAVPRSAALANGGTLRVSREPAGPFALSVYTAPTPLRVGLADVSVAVEVAATGDTEPNARVIIFAEPIGRDGPRIASDASHERATDPSFYAADLSLASAGRWRIEVVVLNAVSEGTVEFEVDVEPAVVATPTVPSLPDAPVGILPVAAWGQAIFLVVLAALLIATVARRFVMRRGVSR